MTPRSPLTFARAALPALALVLAACNSQEAAAPAPVRPVLSVIAEARSEQSLSVAGTVQPQVRTDLSFRVLGRIIARDVRVGDLVAKDQLMAALDPTQLELAVRAARANLASAQAQFANALSTEARQRSLLESRTASEATFESAEQAREAAQASVTRAEASLAKAQEQLGYAQIKAEYDGVVTATGAEVGQVVSPGVPVVTVARPDLRDAVVDIPEWVGDQLRIGTPFDVTLQVNPDLKVKGAIREIAPQADQATRTLRVRIALQDPPVPFRLGTTVTATVTAKAQARIELPRSALLERDGKTMVWIIDPATSTVALREVTIGPRSEQTIAVLSGLEAGARVVTAGVNSLSAGQKVRIEEGPRA
ncbi:efflux RND transporter periplasmic adaptor subunit [Phreatobacter stygius]|uniref:Efflux RND transporter periplasmic adaptor subunit n=1 Tax=Phreatobacter stygius TaxID=1940610 RepID=A0A4D7B8X0_9HYPH|nr:efflux RND transporter periplasmic adaptor subunit [Phreatobacter stygius]QCI66900.1 efflux RND transporter periplasmic adaptor subunit [Phreatobacter stygius]